MEKHIPDNPKSDLQKRTEDFALRIIRMYGALPKTTEAQVLGNQVLRSGTSVGAHYAESMRARSNPEFISKIDVLLQELQETEYWLKLLVRAGQTTEKRMHPLLQESLELNAIFTTISKNRKGLK